MAINQPIEAEPVDVTPILSVTQPAVDTIRNLLQQRNIPNHALRVFVTGGGCSGVRPITACTPQSAMDAANACTTE